MDTMTKRTETGPRWRIVSAAGEDMGTFTAPTADAAHAAMVRDAGYDSIEAAAKALGTSADELRRELTVTPADGA